MINKIMETMGYKKKSGEINWGEILLDILVVTLVSIVIYTAMIFS